MLNQNRYLFYGKLKSILFCILPLCFLSISTLSFAQKIKHKPIAKKKVILKRKLRDAFKIGSNQIDRLFLGKTLEEVYSRYGKSRIQRVMVFDANSSYDRYDILSMDQKTILYSIIPDCREIDSLCIIKRFIIRNKDFHTSRNLRVGLTYRDLLNTKQEINYLGWFEDNLVGRTATDSINYIFDTESIPKDKFGNLDKCTLPENTKISGIILSGKDLNGYNLNMYDSTFLNILLQEKIKSLNIQDTSHTTLYKVGRGETLFSISKKFNLSIQDIIDRNKNISNYRIKLGEAINIPKIAANAFTNSKRYSESLEGDTLRVQPVKSLPNLKINTL